MAFLGYIYSSFLMFSSFHTINTCDFHNYNLLGFLFKQYENTKQEWDIYLYPPSLQITSYLNNKV